MFPRSMVMEGLELQSQAPLAPLCILSTRAKRVCGWLLVQSS